MMKSIKPIAAVLSILLVWVNPAYSGVRITIVKTAEAPVPEAMLISGGDWSVTKILNHAVVLVEHSKFQNDRLMFDAGLGSNVEHQRNENLNWLMRKVPLLGYQNLRPARQQLPSSLYPKYIVLSHSHWDHTSGLSDFPEAEVWVSAEERAYARLGGPPAVFADARDQASSWKEVNFGKHPVCGFESSKDVYGDQSVLLVSMPGHTPGSVGMLVTTESGRKLFFVGDTVWQKKGITEQLTKPLISRTADDDPAKVRTLIERLSACVRSDPKIEIVPAHDSEIQNKLGYFPAWIE